MTLTKFIDESMNKENKESQPKNEQLVKKFGNKFSNSQINNKINLLRDSVVDEKPNHDLESASSKVVYNQNYNVT